jgi:hypothetical protein
MGAQPARVLADPRESMRPHLETLALQFVATRMRRTRGRRRSCDRRIDGMARVRGGCLPGRSRRGRGTRRAVRFMVRLVLPDDLHARDAGTPPPLEGHGRGVARGRLSDDDASGAGARAPIRVRTPECRRERLVWVPGGQSVRVDERLVAVCEQELGEQPCGAVKVLAVGDEQHELTLEFQALNGNDLQKIAWRER